MKNLLLSVGFVSCFGAALAACAQSPFEAPAEGLLLLKNGRTLGGKISRTGDYYVVASPESELQIRSHDVDAVCRDWEEAYRHKSSRINPRSADDRLELAQWCLDYHLPGHAAREITEAYRIDDLHPRVPLLERRLRAEMTEPKPTPPPAPLTPVKREVDELADVAKSVSHETMLEFTTRVQPLLVNYCATAGCHGPRPASNFQLQRVYLHETRDPRLVRANLAAVLAQIDRKQPQQSPLLTAPVSAHGGAKKAIFHAHNADHYRQLAAWVMRAAAGSGDATAVKTPATVNNAPEMLLQRLPLAVPPQAAEAAAPAEPAATPAAAIELPASAAPVVPAAAAETATEPAGVDPFDPALFNRRREPQTAPPPSQP